MRKAKNIIALIVMAALLFSVYMMAVSIVEHHRERIEKINAIQLQQEMGWKDAICV